MKFGKRLKQQVQDTLPEWRDKFLSYKELKKLLRLLSTAPTSLLNGKCEAEFMYLLNNEIDKFNGFFMEQEEDFIIRHKVNTILIFLFLFYKIYIKIKLLGLLNKTLILGICYVSSRQQHKSLL